MTTKPTFAVLATSFAGGPRPRNAALILAMLWLAIFFASLFAPPLLDDADATHAQAAQHIALTGNLVTLHVDGIRYLEKAPFPYWLVALSYKIFGFNTFATHLPQALAVALLALLGHRWANHAFGSRTAFYTAIALLTSLGTFLFTRIFIPEIWLSLFLAAALYTFLRSLQASPQPDRHPGQSAAQLKDRNALPTPTTARTVHPPDPAPTPERPASIFPLNGNLYPYLTAISLALAVLSKGLVALLLFSLTTLLYLALVDGLNKQTWQKLRPFTATALFLLIAAPWHIAAALQNPATPTHHGFLWFYFWNEHVLRFLGRRLPADYNKLPGTLFWLQHLLWLFPWTLFLPLPLTALWRRFRHQQVLSGAYAPAKLPFLLTVLLLSIAFPIFKTFGIDPSSLLIVPSAAALVGLIFLSRRSTGLTPSPFHRIDPQQRTILLLALSAALTLLFFSLSTNQEYYTFPAYLPLLLLTSATITRAEQTYASSPSSQRWITVAHVAFFALGLLAALALLGGLIASRHLPYTPDIGTLLAHRGLGSYTLATSHLFDLTAAAFAALRFPAALAAFALLLGPTVAWQLRMQRRHLAATTSIGLTAALFLVAAQLAFARFAPLLSSRDFASAIRARESQNPGTQTLLFGDQSFGSSIPFYLGHPVALVDGRSTSLQFGSSFPDAPPLFLTPAELQRLWSQPTPTLLFVPAERREEALRLLPPNPQILRDQSGKLLLSNH